MNELFTVALTAERHNSHSHFEICMPRCLTSADSLTDNSVSTWELSSEDAGKANSILWLRYWMPRYPPDPAKTVCEGPRAKRLTVSLREPSSNLEILVIEMVQVSIYRNGSSMDPVTGREKSPVSKTDQSPKGRSMPVHEMHLSFRPEHLPDSHDVQPQPPTPCERVCALGRIITKCLAPCKSQVRGADGGNFSGL